MSTDTVRQKATKNKGGRPAKPIKRNQLLGVKCSFLEKKTIQAKAKYSGLTVSEFLRNLGSGCKVDRPKMIFPKEILQFTGTLNHLAANLNQIAKKRSQFDELNALERAQLQQLSAMVKQLALDIKKHLQ